jgi:hypothetical protein
VHREKRLYKLLAVIVFIFIIAWTLWLTYPSQGSFRIISSIFANVISKREIVELPAKIISPPSTRIVTLSIKEVITAFEILSGAAIMFWGLANIKTVKIRQRLLVLAIFFTVCILGIAISSLFPSLTLGAYLRFYWFSLMPFSILIPLYLLNSKGVSHPKLEKFNKAFNWAFIIVLMVFLSLSPITIHDNDPGYYYPSSSLKGAEFAVKNLKGNVIWVKHHVHLIEYMALRNGILFEGYMGFQGNETTRFISLPTYIKMYGNKSSNYYAVIFNDYEDSLDVLTGNIDSVSQRHLYEKQISQKLNLVYSDGSIRIYAKSK